MSTQDFNHMDFASKIEVIGKTMHTEKAREYLKDNLSKISNACNSVYNYEIINALYSEDDSAQAKEETKQAYGDVAEASREAIGGISSLNDYCKENNIGEFYHLDKNFSMVSFAEEFTSDMNDYAVSDKELQQNLENDLADTVTEYEKGTFTRMNDYDLDEQLEKIATGKTFAKPSAFDKLISAKNKADNIENDIAMAADKSDTTGYPNV